MKRMKFLSAVVIISVCLASCATSQSLTTNQNQNQTSVVLQGANYKIVRQVSGEAKGKGTYSAIANNAYVQMIQNANLKEAQAIIYINYERIDDKVIATGTVIEFIK